jgi:hypothetical protein
MTECEIGYRTNQAEFDLILGNLTTACALAPNLQTLKVRFCRALFSDTGILRSPFQVQDLKRIRNEIRDMVKASLGNAKKVSVVSEAWGLHSWYHGNDELKWLGLSWTANGRTGE